MKALVVLLQFFLFSSLFGHTTCWYTPISLSSPGQNASAPAVAMNPFTGDAVAVWIEPDGLYANTMTYVPVSTSPCMLVGGSTWGTKVKVANLSGGGGIEPLLVMDFFGTATVVWVEGDSILLSTLPAGGSWSIPISLPYSIDSPAQIQLAIEPISGTLGLIWAFNGTIQSVIKTLALANWPMRVDVLAYQGADFPKMAIGAGGTVAAVWHAKEGEADLIYSSKKENVNSNWTRAELISDLAYSSTNPNVAVDGEGNIEAIWFRYFLRGTNYSEVVLQRAVRSAKGLWEMPRDISNPGIYNPNFLSNAVLFNSAGVAVYVWTTSFDGSLFALQGFWNDPNAYIIDFVVPDPYIYSFSATINQIGRGFGAFPTLNTITEVSISGLDITTISAQVGVQGPYLLSSPLIPQNGNPKITSGFVAPYSVAVAVWEGFDGANKMIFAASAQKEIIPTPTNPQVIKATNDLNVFVEYYNYITWDPVIFADITSYEILRNGLFIASIPHPMTEYRDDNRLPFERDQYLIFAKDMNGDQSLPAEALYP